VIRDRWRAEEAQPPRRFEIGDVDDADVCLNALARDDLRYQVERRGPVRAAVEGQDLNSMHLPRQRFRR
jgi:hypothetical protein